MNFDNEEPIDALIGRLIAFIIMFQKKIENIKCKITGNQHFHTRLAFQALDIFKKNEIDADTLHKVINTNRLQEKEENCSFFLRKYSKNHAITYDEFLKLLAPKGNRILGQGMLIRPYQKGASLQPSLWNWVLQLLQLYIKMSAITQSIRVAIYHCQNLSYLQLVEFFKLTIRSGPSLLNFMNRCSSEQYDIQVEDVIYLSYHLKSGHQISEFTDMDIKEILLPLNYSFQKQNTQRNFYKTPVYTKQPQFKETQQANFLGKTYQKMYQKNESSKETISKKVHLDSSVNNRSQNYTSINSNRLPFAFEPTSRIDKSYGPLYIDNFTRSQLNPVLELNQFIGANRESRKQVEFFHDELNSNYSSLSRRSKESAFDRS